MLINAISGFLCDELEIEYSDYFKIRKRNFYYLVYKPKCVSIIKFNSHLSTIWNISRSVIFLFASLAPLITMTQRLQFLKTEAGMKMELLNKNTFYLGPTAKS